LRETGTGTGGEEEVLAALAGGQQVLADVPAELVADPDRAVLLVLG
jgi:hypothetical protein